MTNFLAAPFEAHTVHAAVDFRHAQDVLDLLGNGGALGHVDGLAAKATGLRPPFGDQIAHDDAGGAQQLTRRRASFCHGVVLLARPAADTDRAYHLAVTDTQ